MPIDDYARTWRDERRDHPLQLNEPQGPSGACLVPILVSGLALAYIVFQLVRWWIGATP